MTCSVGYRHFRHLTGSKQDRRTREKERTGEFLTYTLGNGMPMTICFLLLSNMMDFSRRKSQNLIE
jgi:hypothetical protein